MILRPTRRGLLTGLAGAAALGAAGTGAYAVGVEPIFRLEVTSYALTPPGWPAALDLTAVVLADFHAGEPWMSPGRIAEIVAVTNALRPDVVFLLGDYEPGHPFNTRAVPMARVARELAGLRAPLGIHAVLGNHDWWADFELVKAGGGMPVAAKALREEGIRVLENDAVRLVKDGRPFWVAGLADQMVFFPVSVWRGLDDLAGTLRRVTDDAPVILLAHEPRVMRRVPPRVSLTLSGHTHGGQVRVAGFAPMVGGADRRYVYGHIVDRHPDGDRHIVVSGGLGTSKLPVRLGSPPEIVLLRLGRGGPGIA